jgi:hypothetical protein
MRRSRWRRLRYAQHTETPDSVVLPTIFESPHM